MGEEPRLERELVPTLFPVQEVLTVKENLQRLGPVITILVQVSFMKFNEQDTSGEVSQILSGITFDWNNIF